MLVVGWADAGAGDESISGLLPCVKGTGAAADMHVSPTMLIMLLMEGQCRSAFDANAGSLCTDGVALSTDGAAVRRACVGGGGGWDVAG